MTIFDGYVNASNVGRAVTNGKVPQNITVSILLSINGNETFVNVSF